MKIIKVIIALLCALPIIPIVLFYYARECYDSDMWPWEF